MKHHSTMCIGVGMLIFLFMPVMALAQTAAGALIHERVAEEKIRLFIDEYTKRFTKMDLEPYMALFSERGVENRALPYPDIRRAYQKTIEVSQAIQFEVKILTIQTWPDHGFVSARYRLTQTLKSGRARTFQGDIQWALIREGGALKIREVNYGIDR